MIGAMTAETRDQITFTLGTFITLSTIIALGVKFILLPWLREHLVGPMAETQRQVTENSHANETPTVPDLIHDLATDVKALTHVMDQHLTWSDRWSNLQERELDQLRRTINLHHPEGTETE